MTWAGTDFTGTLNVTLSGRTCQSWSEQTPHGHNQTNDADFPDGSAALAGNNCRNPNGTRDNGVWCYTTDPDVPWEWCNVTLCRMSDLN